MSGFGNFWNKKKVLLTGNTGFKGGWLSLWLSRLGADVTGIGLLPCTPTNLFELLGVPDFCRCHFGDIRDYNFVLKTIKETNPDIVFHLAAQPLVHASYNDPIESFSTNIMGTAHVLEAMRWVDNAHVAVMVTTDKVYSNKEWLWPYRENDRIGGHDPYSASKAASEIVIDSYRDAFLSAKGVLLASARAGNVIGGGDWSKDRLIPDAIRAWNDGKSLEVRRPDAIRPWQHVLEPLAGYITLAEKLWAGNAPVGPYNFGPETNEEATVREVIELARTVYGQSGVVYVPHKEGLHETTRLALDISKSQKLLGLEPRVNISQAVHKAISWYQEQRHGANAKRLCEDEIEHYEELL